MTQLLEVRQLVCGYADRTVLQGISLTAQKGEAIALLGPNGSGKSTLIKAISKSISIESGEISISGHSLQSMDDRQMAQLVSVVPQEESNPFAFTVREVVTLGRIARSTGIFDTPEDRAVAEDSMTRAECREFAGRPVTELSGGEKQRVYIARALAQGSDLLLLDEPTSHLDAPHQLSVAALIRSLTQEGKSVLAAVHDLNLATQFASRAVLLNKGKIVLDGPLENVLESPELDKTYGVAFERIRSSEGRLFVMPRQAQYFQ